MQKLIIESLVKFFLLFDATSMFQTVQKTTHITVDVTKYTSTAAKKKQKNFLL